MEPTGWCENNITPARTAPDLNLEWNITLLDQHGKGGIRLAESAPKVGLGTETVAVVAMRFLRWSTAAPSGGVEP